MGPAVDSRTDADALLRAIRWLVRRFALSERADVSCCGMTVAQAATLEALRLQGPTRLTDLGQRLGISPSTLSRNLARLEERAFVRRVPDEQDARAAVARLTPEGERAAESVEAQSVGFAGAILDQLPPDRRPEVLRSVDELLGAVRRATENCCPGAFDHLMREPDSRASDCCAPPDSTK